MPINPNPELLEQLRRLNPADYRADCELYQRIMERIYLETYQSMQMTLDDEPIVGMSSINYVDDRTVTWRANVRLPASPAFIKLDLGFDDAPKPPPRSCWEHLLVDDAVLDSVTTSIGCHVAIEHLLAHDVLA